MFKSDIINTISSEIGNTKVASELFLDSFVETINEFGLNRTSEDIKIANKLKKQVPKLFNQGLSFEDVGKKLNCHGISVASKAKKLGLKRDFSSIKQPSLLYSKYNKIKKMLEDRYTQIDIAKVLCVAETILIYNIKKGDLKNA